MRLAIVLVLLAGASPALGQPMRTFPDPVLDPAGVTAEQAALDIACERRVQLPRARPYKPEQAMAATGRATIRDGQLVVGRHSYDAMIGDDEIGYRYVGRYKAAPVDIILEDDAESVGWTIIDEAGGVLEVPHLLIPSPDGHVWATSTDWRDGFGKIALYERGAGAWSEIATIPVDMACDLRWIDAMTLGFHTTGNDLYSPPGPEQRIVHENGKWTRKPS